MAEYQETTEVPNGPPALNWHAMDGVDYDATIVAIGYFIGICLIGRIMLKVLGLLGTCITGWMLMEIASYTMAGFLANPAYCIVMAVVAGYLTYLALIVISEAVRAPGRIWWKITR